MHTYEYCMICYDMNLIDLITQTIHDDYFDVENGNKQQRGLVIDQDPFFSIFFLLCLRYIFLTSAKFNDCSVFRKGHAHNKLNAIYQPHRIIKVCYETLHQAKQSLLNQKPV